jgi:hypothetical protein
LSRVVRTEAQSSAPIETVWQLLSTVDTWPTWSRHKVARLERDGSPTPDGVGAIRVLGANASKPARWNREEVVTFDAPSHFGYALLSGLPLDDYHSDVRLFALPSGGTRISWVSRFAAHRLTGWFWVLVVRWILKRWSADLARGAERVAVRP